MLGVRKNLIEHEVLGGWSLKNRSVRQNQNSVSLPKRAMIITPVGTFSMPDPLLRPGCLSCVLHVTSPACYSQRRELRLKRHLAQGMQLVSGEETGACRCHLTQGVSGNYAEGRLRAEEERLALSTSPVSACSTVNWKRFRREPKTKKRRPGKEIKMD